MMINGYSNRFLRIDLSKDMVKVESFDNVILERYIGGTGLSSLIMLNEVPKDVKWNDKENKIIFATGPLSGTLLPGTGAISIISKGPMTNLFGASQANGKFGAYLKLNGIDGLIVQGCSSELSYILIKDGKCSIYSAKEITMEDTWETDDFLKNTITNDSSVLCIGPAGENMVKFACISVDKGHIAAHNGLGAVMGSKNLKAIVVEKSNYKPHIFDSKEITKLSREIYQDAKVAWGGYRARWGTAGGYVKNYSRGILPVKNLTTSIWGGNIESFSGQSLRAKFATKPKPCWHCAMHCREMTFIDNNKSYTIEEPEYESIAAFSSLIDNNNVIEMLKLSNLVDRMGLDVNETGWLLAWVMECFEEGIITSKQLESLQMNWGNTHSCAQLIKNIAYKNGIGNILAEGVMRASGIIGGEGKAIFTKKGATPRTHDHRAKWDEFLDTCCSNTSTIESAGGSTIYSIFDIDPPSDKYSFEEVARYNAVLNGRRQFEDSLVVCRFISERFDLLIDYYNNVTGRNISIKDALFIGKRIVNTMRLFNVIHGVTPEIEMPSERYASIIKDGNKKGLDIGKNFLKMRKLYWEHMEWDQYGIPTKEVLEKYDIPIISDLI